MKLYYEVEWIGDELASANGKNNSWKAAAECNSPKELIEKLKFLCGDISDQNTTIESYKRSIKKWKEATGCDTPEEAEKKIKLLVDDINVLMRVNDDLM